jgi:hypothetical protein
MADINPFAHIKPDARLQQSAVNTSSALDALKQAMAVQSSKNTAALDRQKLAEITKKYGHNVGANLPTGNASVDPTLLRRSNLEYANNNATLNKVRQEGGQIAPLQPNDHGLTDMTKRALANIAPISVRSSAAGKETSSIKEDIDNRTKKPLGPASRTLKSQAPSAIPKIQFPQGASKTERAVGPPPKKGGKTIPKGWQRIHRARKGETEKHFWLYNPATTEIRLDD